MTRNASVEPDVARRSRRRAYHRGRLSEALCRLILRLKGYRIVARNFRAPVGEIDIVARRGRTLAVIEVKARDRLEDAAEALGARQRYRIGQATLALLAERPGLTGLAVRFDVMLVRPWRLPRHLIGAWSR